MKNNKFIGIEETICGALLVVVFACVIVQVVNRKFIGASLPWTEELARYAFIWLSFIGISIGVKRNKHMAVDALKVMFPQRTQTVIEVVVDVVLLVIFFIIASYSFTVVNKLLTYSQKSPGLKLQIGYIYLAAPVGFSMAIIRIIQNNIKRFVLKGGMEK